MLWDKTFQEGPNISENYGAGIQILLWGSILYSFTSPLEMLIEYCIVGKFGELSMISQTKTIQMSTCS